MMMEVMYQKRILEDFQAISYLLLSIVAKVIIKVEGMI